MNIIGITLLFIHAICYLTNKYKYNRYLINDELYIHNHNIIKIIIKFNFSYINLFLLGLFLYYPNLVYLILLGKILKILYIIYKLPSTSIKIYKLYNLLLFAMLFCITQNNIIKLISCIGVIFIDYHIL